jgi:A/G-specific adenine glycosylase
MLTPEEIGLFQQHIWLFYHVHGRTFAWRFVQDPYKVVVSEIMLQQTQTIRVAQKYEQFLAEFPSFIALSAAPVRDVLSLWQGLGYNRRGKALHAIAYRVTHEFGGQLPPDPVVLATFPGIGPATAGSICAFAFNMPTVFIETNIRAVYIASFFNQAAVVHDNELLPLIAVTLDTANPRMWYYALMDYGVFLKKNRSNPSRRSKHYVKQSKFEGSDRQIRGMVIKALTQTSRMTYEQLQAYINKEPARLGTIIDDLCKEHMITIRDGYFFL